MIQGKEILFLVYATKSQMLKSHLYHHLSYQIVVAIWNVGL
jgi:hypothetical protein